MAVENFSKGFGEGLAKKNGSGIHKLTLFLVITRGKFLVFGFVLRCVDGCFIRTEK